MPVYNGEAYLREAIDSIIEQTFTDWEFIIVNEYGSNDAATAILNEYEKKDSRIRVIQNTQRLRIAESLNVGLRAATGEYIARMDGDDICGKRRFEAQLAFLDSHPDIDICGIEVSMFGENTWDWNVYCGSEYLHCACLFYTPFVHPTIMMRRSSLQKYSLEYDKRFIYTEDFDFFVRASENLKFENIKDRSLYHYRFLSDNATNVGGDRGLAFQREVMARTFTRYGLEFTADEILLLSPNTSRAITDVHDALMYLESLDLLLKRVFLTKELQEKFGLSLLFRVLHRRWMDAYEQVRWKPNIMEDGQVQRAVDRGLFCHEDFWDGSKVTAAGDSPLVSILVPTYNSEDYIMDTVYSLLEQDLTDFEFLIVNELGSDDRTVECVELFRDPRIRILQNDVRLGLAESLNRGIREAKGKYIARADADDVYPRERLSRQVAYMEQHPEIGVCSTWQRHFGERNYIHMPPASPEEMKANLLFKCEVCHSTLLLRRDAFIRYNLWYDNTYLSEDYELWCRASTKIGFATIPEVLGEYRWNGDNITVQKMDRLDLEAQKLVARNLKNHLKMEIKEEDLILLSGWKNPFYESNPDYIQLREREEALLNAIEEKNRKVRAFDPAALKKVLDERRVWAFLSPAPVESEPAQEAAAKVTTKQRIKGFLKRILKRFYQPFRSRYENRLIRIEDVVWREQGMLSHLQKTLENSDGHLYDYYSSLQKTLRDTDNSLQDYCDRLQQLVTVQSQQILQLQQHQILLNEKIAQMQGQAQVTAEMILQHISAAEQRMNQATDNRIAAAEKLINQATGDRIDEAETLINQTTDSRIWEAEKLINQTTDSRIWEAEKLINQTTDGRIWEAEKLINQTTDGRIWEAEKNLSGMKKDNVDELHRHIDFTYRDLMIMQERNSQILSAGNVELSTEYPVAYESLDHLYPHGTIRDNTRYPRFVEKCEQLIGSEKKLAFLDLGCSGGGMVLEAALRGHLSVGLEGSNSSQIAQRAEWRLLKDNLKTCDITKPFSLSKDGKLQHFDIITAWEVLEHISEKDLSQLFRNIQAHLAPTGYFIGSIANWDDIDPETGVNWHVTVHPYDWWVSKFEEAGFEVCSELVDVSDLARGGYNPPHCYEAPYPEVDLSKSFHIVVRKGA